MRKIDIGCGPSPTEGFEPWDINLNGRDASRLDGISDGQLSVIRASHVLEHISFRRTLEVLTEWARALEVGGELFVAVPDFDKIIKGYVDGNAADTEPVLLGAHSDEHDCHHAIFNERKLAELLGLAGFDVVDRWAGEEGKCSSHPWSMNFRAIKRGVPRLPLAPLPDVLCLMSMPRLAWTDNMHAVVDACTKLRINYVRATGVFWGQCLQRMLEDAVADGRFKYALTVDYDTVFTPHDIMLLRHIAETNDLDVLAPLQVGRDRDELLVKIDDGTGKPLARLERSKLSDQWWSVLHAHFGLTLISLEGLRRMEKPWFKGVPGPDGSWGDERIDDDIWFWHQARKCGLKVGITPQVVVGHMQVMCTWPDRNLRPVHQYMKDYVSKGRPSWDQRQQPSSS